jgi:hypothetical protein
MTGYEQPVDVELWKALDTLANQQGHGESDELHRSFIEFFGETYDEAVKKAPK